MLDNHCLVWTKLNYYFAQIFSCCPKNLSCPNFGVAAAPLAPPGPYAYGQENCDLRVLIIDNVLQKKACSFVFDCLLRMELHVSRLGNYFQRFHVNYLNIRNNEKAAKLPKVKLDFARRSFYFLGALCNERKFHRVKRLFGLSNQIGGKVEQRKQGN